MIATSHIDPFADLIALGLIRPLESRGAALRLAGRILRPVSIDALTEIVLRANRAGAPFMFVGGATAIGRAPAEFVKRARTMPAIAISFELLNRVVEYRPLDFAVTVEAGMPLAQLRDLLAMRGQTVMLDSAEIATATIGGLLASARTGPRRRSLGRPRDAVLGATLVLADGSTVEVGGRSLRQAQGYDIARLFCGAHGTLGAFATVTLRTRPLPEARRCAIATLPDGSRERAVAAVERLRVEPTAAVLLDGFERRLPGWEGPDGRLFLYFEGSETAIARATRDLRTAFGAIGISETRIFDREAEGLLDALHDAPLARGGRESSACLRVRSNTQTAMQMRERIHRVTAEIGVTAEIISDLQNDDVLARVRASGPRTLEISAREIFIRLAAEFEHAELMEAPAAFRSKFEDAQHVDTVDENLKALRETFDPQALCAVDRSLFIE